MKNNSQHSKSKGFTQHLGCLMRRAGFDSSSFFRQPALSRWHRNQGAGFTLIEMLVTIFVFSMLMIGVTLLFQTILTSSTQQNSSLSAADQARKLTFDFVNEVRAATTGNDGSFPLQYANESQIILYSGYGAGSGVVNRLRYYVSNNTLFKGVVTPTGNPLTYNLASEKVTSVQTGLMNNAVPVFYYYNENYTGTSTPLNQPVNVNQVRFVKINLILLAQSIRNSTSTFTVTAGATIRNLKTNLGN